MASKKVLTVSMVEACYQIAKLTGMSLHPTTLGKYFNALYNRKVHTQWCITQVQIEFFAEFWKTHKTGNFEDLKVWALQNNKMIPSQYTPPTIKAVKATTPMNDTKLQRMVDEAVSRQMKEINATLKEIKGSLLLKDETKKD
jgi:hypothetical protein